MINTRKKDFTPLILLLAMIILWGIMHQWLGGSFFGPTFYNTYTLQALAWRDGLLHLPCDYPYLELAIFEGEFYVSFPPLPSVILFPLTFLFGNQTPDNLLVKLYAAAACLMMYVSFRRAGYSRLSGGLFSFLFCFASSLLPLTLNGAVWYHAQVLAFFLITAAICLLSMDFPAPALLCYALSVACRPFHAMYALPLFFVYWRLNQQAGFQQLCSQLLLICKAQPQRILRKAGLGAQKRTLSLADIDDVFRFENLDRLAHGGSAYAKARHQFRLRRELGAGLHFFLNDHLAQLVRDLFRQLSWFSHGFHSSTSFHGR